jgi:ribonuclease H2 subunit A
MRRRCCCCCCCCCTCATRSYADSKTLTEAERSKLFKALAADPHCLYAADLLSAVDISRQMLGRHKVSLNAIAETSTIGLIQAVLDAGVNLTEVGEVYDEDCCS